MVYFIRWISCGIKEKILVERYYNCKSNLHARYRSIVRKNIYFSENVLDETQQGIGDTTSERYY